MISDFQDRERKYFPIQKFPSDLAQFQINISPTEKFITKELKISSMGSCYTRQISSILINKGYNYLITEYPFTNGSAHWQQVLNTSSMRQIFEYSLSETWAPVERWWVKDCKLQDPYRLGIVYNKDDHQYLFSKHVKSSREALVSADLIILTLSVIEIWRNKHDKKSFCRVPPLESFDERNHEFYIQSIEDCIDDLKYIVNILKTNNNNVKIIFQLCPIPLMATFRQDVDILTANNYSKSVLRVAIEYIVSNFKNTFYFPCYELIHFAKVGGFEDDERHPKIITINNVMNTFESIYCHVMADNISQSTIR